METAVVAMTPEERERLRPMSDACERVEPAGVGEWLLHVAVAAIYVSFALILAWIVTHIVRDVAGANGWGAGFWRAAPWLGAAAVALGAIAVRRAFARDARTNLLRALGPYRADAEAALVREERYRVLECRAVREPDEGGRIYLLRTHDGRCLVVFDHASFDLAESGADPAASPLRPAREAILRWAPQSELLLGLRFEGEPFAPCELEPLDHPVPDWSHDARLWEHDWAEVERRLR